MQTKGSEAECNKMLLTKELKVGMETTSGFHRTT